jgi:CubicO group peptidase (beta-lactamase class C family)
METPCRFLSRNQSRELESRRRVFKLAATATLLINLSMWVDPLAAQTTSPRPMVTTPPLNSPQSVNPSSMPPTQTFLQIIPPPGQPGAPLGKIEDTETERRLYSARFSMMASGGTGGDATALYDTREAVPGAARLRPIPLASEAQRTISNQALEAARAYAGANNSNALLVWRAGKMELEAYFGTHTATSETVSRSLAKPMATAAIGRALALGKIKSLDQPVADFIPEWRADPRRARILVRHLLDMRTGFLRQSIATSADDVLNRAYLHPRHAEVIVTEYPVPDEPGSVYEYNNATSELVAYVIERATGRRYAEFISREILQPIGAPGGNVWVNREGGTAHSGCCLMVPATTWLKLAQLYLDDGKAGRRRLLPAGFVAEMRTPTAQNPHYGLGVYVAGAYTQRLGAFNPLTVRGVRGTLHSQPYLADDVFMFDGNANQIVYIVPSQQLIIVRTGNPPPRGAGIPEWDNSFLPNTLIGGIVRNKGTSTVQR